MYARLVIGDFYDGDSFLSVLGTTPTFFENCALLGLVGKVRTSSVQALKNKSCFCAAGIGAAPRLPTAALTQQSFVNV